MYEDITYERLLEEKLAQVPDTLDKRQGGIMYNTIAPNSAELARAYLNLALAEDRFFADTATEDDLDSLCKERGITRDKPTFAVRLGEFTFSTTDGKLYEGTRFRAGEIVFYSGEEQEKGKYRMNCETPGSIGNDYLGSLVPVEDVEGLSSARLTTILIPGEDRENDESLRKRYYETLNTQSYGGNIADYKKWVRAIAGVGGEKVLPVWDGGGTVGIILIDSTYSVPSGVLIETVQNELDPCGHQGEGVGLAPIGHVVSVWGVKENPLTIGMRLERKEGYTVDMVLEDIKTAIEKYFKSLSSQWSDEDVLTVRISQIENRVIGVTGVIDVLGLTINGENQNLILEADEIPVLRTVEVT